MHASLTSIFCNLRYLSFKPTFLWRPYQLSVTASPILFHHQFFLKSYYIRGNREWLPNRQATAGSFPRVSHSRSAPLLRPARMNCTLCPQRVETSKHSKSHAKRLNLPAFTLSTRSSTSNTCGPPPGLRLRAAMDSVRGDRGEATRRVYVAAW